MLCVFLFYILYFSQFLHNFCILFFYCKTQRWSEAREKREKNLHRTLTYFLVIKFWCVCFFFLHKHKHLSESMCTVFIMSFFFHNEFQALGFWTNSWKFRATDIQFELDNWKSEMNVTKQTNFFSYSSSFVQKFDT